MIELEENTLYFKFDKNKLIENFNSYSKLGTIYYPIKTNSNQHVLEELIRVNSGFLVTTLNNFELLKETNIDIAKVCIINVLAEKETIKYYYDNGVRFFTFDNMNALLDFSKYADLSKTKIVVRLSTMQIFEDKFTHLGANLEETLEMISFLKDKCSEYGISFYIQNDLKQQENVLQSIFNYIVDNYSNLGLKFANVGGINLESQDSEEILNKLKSTLHLEECIVEIGRDLVQNCMEVETRIIREKTINNKKVVIIKNGIYSGFFHTILYNKKFQMCLKLKNGKEVNMTHERSASNNFEFFLCGGSSESGDKIGTMYINDKYQEELVEGATIILKNAGAYFEEFFMAYGNDLKCIINSK